MVLPEKGKIKKIKTIYHFSSGAQYSVDGAVTEELLIDTCALLEWLKINCPDDGELTRIVLEVEGADRPIIFGIDKA